MTNIVIKVCVIKRKKSNSIFFAKKFQLKKIVKIKTFSSQVFCVVCMSAQYQYYYKITTTTTNKLLLLLLLKLINEIRIITILI